MLLLVFPVSLMLTVGAVLSSIFVVASCPTFLPSVSLANTISPWCSPVTLVPVVQFPSSASPICHSIV